jgi:hypothetical protein
MTDAPSRAVMLFGTEEKVTPAKTLRAGPLTVEFDGANLRYVKLHGVEALRGIAFIVRDRHWGTYPAEIRNLKVGQGAASFEVSYEAVCRDQTQRLHYRARVTGRSDGTLEFVAEGVAETEFLSNRVGFVVLHPLAGVAGAPVRVTHTDGSVEEARFPRLISPGQPFFDLRALAHEVLPGLWATCTMEGDAYEMEDHRNWTDASYKTYIRPLSKPRPFTLQAGERFTQRVALTLEGRAQATVAGAGADAEIEIQVGGAAGSMPAIGLWVPPEETATALAVVDEIKRIAPGFLVGQLDLRDRDARRKLGDLKDFAYAVGAPVMLEIVLPNVRLPAAELQAAAALARAVDLRPEAVHAAPHEYLKSWQPNEAWPEVPPLEEIYDAARAAFPGSRIGGGVLAYFTELNRKRPPMAHADFISHTTSPLVHDADDRSVMETLEALPWVAESGRAMAAGKPYRVGPSLLGMRTNPYGAAPVDNPDNRRLAMARNDPRQRGLFGAAWYLGYAARMAEAGVEALALSAPVGAFGVVHTPAAFPQPWYERQGAGVYPAYHVLRGLAEGAGHPRLDTEVPNGSLVLAVAWRDGGAMVLWLANLTGERQAVQIAGVPASDVRLTMLDAAAFVAAATGAEGLESGTRQSAYDRLELDAFALARLQIP